MPRAILSPTPSPSLGGWEEEGPGGLGLPEGHRDLALVVQVAWGSVRGGSLSSLPPDHLLLSAMTSYFLH